MITGLRSHHRWLAFDEYDGRRRFLMGVCQVEAKAFLAVSYTHLTLPTIYSV